MNTKQDGEKKFIFRKKKLEMQSRRNKFASCKRLLVNFVVKKEKAFQHFISSFSGDSDNFHESF